MAIYGWEYFDPHVTGFIAGPADFFISRALPAVGIILFWLYKQATPGKMAISARIVDADTGNTISIGQSIGRYLAFFIPMLPFYLGFIWVAFDSKKQGWHNKLANTVVVRPQQRGTQPVRFDQA